MFARIVTFVFGRNGGRRSYRLVMAGSLLLIVGLLVTGQSLIAASSAEDNDTASVQAGVSDMSMFGKVLSLTKHSPPARPFKVASGPVKPDQFRIPALGINTSVETVGLRNGLMDVPTNVWNVAWYKNSARPGETGNAVIAGHKDTVEGGAIFWDLGQLKAGDRVYISGPDGSELTFEVTEVQSYLSKDVPMERIFGPDSEKHLTLITCDGDFKRDQHTYDKRLVVFTKLV